MSSRGRVLAVDYGSRRLGLAVSDRDGRLAFPAGTLESRGRTRDLEALRALVAERGIARVVVGLPVHMDGRPGPEAEAARGFAREIEGATGLPVDTLDERWTTLEAQRSLRHGGTGERARKGFARARRRAKSKGLADVDSVAATILLRTYLARERADRDGNP